MGYVDPIETPRGHHQKNYISVNFSITGIIFDLKHIDRIFQDLNLCLRRQAPRVTPGEQHQKIPIMYI